MDHAVELVTLRVQVHGAVLPAPLQKHVAVPRVARRAAGSEQLPVWQRDALASGATLNGPALIVERIATTYLAPGWRARVDEVGNLELESNG
jgi:N-methylhydantoinase A